MPETELWSDWTADNTDNGSPPRAEEPVRSTKAESYLRTLAELPDPPARELTPLESFMPTTSKSQAKDQARYDEIWNTYMSAADGSKEKLRWERDSALQAEMADLTAKLSGDAALQDADPSDPESAGLKDADVPLPGHDYTLDRGVITMEAGDTDILRDAGNAARPAGIGMSKMSEAIAWLNQRHLGIADEKSFTDWATTQAQNRWTPAQLDAMRDWHQSSGLPPLFFAQEQ